MTQHQLDRLCSDYAAFAPVFSVHLAANEGERAHWIVRVFRESVSLITK